jgi:hypothetical protein
MYGATILVRAEKQIVVETVLLLMYHSLTVFQASREGYKKASFTTNC